MDHRRESFNSWANKMEPGSPTFQTNRSSVRLADHPFHREYVGPTGRPVLLTREANFVLSATTTKETTTDDASKHIVI